MSEYDWFNYEPSYQESTYYPDYTSYTPDIQIPYDYPTFNEDAFGYSIPQEYFAQPIYQDAQYSQQPTDWSGILKKVLGLTGAIRGVVGAGADIFGGGSNQFRGQTLQQQPGRLPFNSGDEGSGSFMQLPDWQRLAGASLPNP